MRKIKNKRMKKKKHEDNKIKSKWKKYAKTGLLLRRAKRKRHNN